MSFGRCSIRCRRADFTVDVDFVIPEKGVMGIFGHSGSGKTTVLRCIAGLEKTVQGNIEVGDIFWLSARTNLSAQQRNIAYVFQDARLFPHLTVLKNLQYGQKRCQSHNVDQTHLVELLNIGDLLVKALFRGADILNTAQ